MKELTGRDLPGGHSTFTVSFDVKDVAELNAIQSKLLNIRDVIGARRGRVDAAGKGGRTMRAVVTRVSQAEVTIAGQDCRANWPGITHSPGGWPSGYPRPEQISGGENSQFADIQ